MSVSMKELEFEYVTLNLAKDASVIEAKDVEFCESLCLQLFSQGHVSDKQGYWIKKMAAKYKEKLPKKESKPPCVGSAHCFSGDMERCVICLHTLEELTRPDKDYALPDDVSGAVHSVVQLDTEAPIDDKWFKKLAVATAANEDDEAYDEDGVDLAFLKEDGKVDLHFPSEPPIGSSSEVLFWTYYEGYGVTKELAATALSKAGVVGFESKDVVDVHLGGYIDGTKVLTFETDKGEEFPFIVTKSSYVPHFGVKGLIDSSSVKEYAEGDIKTSELIASSPGLTKLWNDLQIDFEEGEVPDIWAKEEWDKEEV